MSTSPADGTTRPRRTTAPGRLQRAAAVALARPVLFDHLPKCGGTTIADFLKWHYLRGRVYEIDGSDPGPDVDRFDALPPAARTRYRLILGHEAQRLIPSFRADAVRFTVLREPVDRVVSHYHYVLRMPRHPLHARVADGKMSLRDYVESGVTDKVRDFYTSHFTGGAGGVDEALATLRDAYSVVGTLEELPAAIARLRAAARLTLRFPAGKRNVTDDRPSVRDLDGRTRRAIEAANGRDLQLYAAVARGNAR